MAWHYLFVAKVATIKVQLVDDQALRKIVFKLNVQHVGSVFTSKNTTIGYSVTGLVYEAPVVRETVHVLWRDSISQVATMLYVPSDLNSRVRNYGRCRYPELTGKASSAVRLAGSKLVREVLIEGWPIILSRES